MAKKQPTPEPETTKLTITVPTGLLPRLKAFADGDRRSVSNAAALLLERALAQALDAAKVG